MGLLGVLPDVQTSTTVFNTLFELYDVPEALGNTIKTQADDHRTELFLTEAFDESDEVRIQKAIAFTDEQGIE